MQTLDSSSFPALSASATWVTPEGWSNEDGHRWTNEDACLDDQQLLDLVHGFGDDGTLARRRVHLEACEECRALFADVEQCLTGPGGSTDATQSRFELLRTIGEGGMGAVVAVWDKVLERQLAMKTLHPWLLSDRRTVVRFFQEAHLMARLEGRGAPRVIDVGLNGTKLPFIVMELIEGETLSARLRRKGGRLPIAEAVRLCALVCDALAVAHGCGIIHRDVKPGNVMLAHEPDGRVTVKLIDFGLAKDEDAQRRASHPGDSFGTPGFIPPEQLRDAHDADARSDLWSVGVLLYRCLTGANPFPGGPQRFMNAYIPPSKRRSDVSRALDDVIARCLKPSPRLRYATAAELAAALRNVGSMAPSRIERADIARVLLMIVGAALLGALAVFLANL